MKKFLIFLTIFFMVFCFIACDEDEQPQEEPQANNPVPTVSSVTPVKKLANSKPFTLTVTGSNFIQDSTIIFDSRVYETNFVSATEMTCTISPDDIPAKVRADISDPDSQDISFTSDYGVHVFVRNPEPGGGDSALTVFNIKSNPEFSKPEQLTSQGEAIANDVTVDSNGVFTHLWQQGTPFLFPFAENYLYVSKYEENTKDMWSEPIRINKPKEIVTSGFIHSIGNNILNVYYSAFRIRNISNDFDQLLINLNGYFKTSSEDNGLTWSKPESSLPVYYNVNGAIPYEDGDKVHFLYLTTEVNFNPWWWGYGLNYIGWDGTEWGPKVNITSGKFFLPVKIYGNRPSGKITTYYQETNNPFNMSSNLYKVDSKYNGLKWEKPINLTEIFNTKINQSSPDKGIQPHNLRVEFYLFGHNEKGTLALVPGLAKVILVQRNSNANENGKQVASIRNPYARSQYSNFEIKDDTYFETTATNFIPILISKDHGDTWDTLEYFRWNIDMKFEPINFFFDSADNMHLLLSVWDDNTPDVLYYSRSTDLGKTWSKPKLVANFNGRVLHPLSTVNDDGKVFLVWHTPYTATEWAANWNIMFTHTIE